MAASKKFALTHSDKRWSVKTAVQANPSAGADFTITVPAGLAWRVRSVFAQLVTSGTVASRQVNLVIKDDQGNIITEVAASGTQAASLTGSYTFAANEPLAGASNTFVIPIPQDLVLPESFTIGSSTGSIQTGDQWQNITVLAEESTVLQ